MKSLKACPHEMSLICIKISEYFAHGRDKQPPLLQERTKTRSRERWKNMFSFRYTIVRNEKESRRILYAKFDV